MARNFNGSTQYAANAAAMSNFVGATAGTIACWYRPTGTPANSANVFGTEPLVSDANAFLGLFRGTINGANDRIYAYNWDTNADYVGFTYTTGAWVHAAWRHSDTTLDAFKDGGYVGSIASGPTGQLTDSFRLAYRGVAYLQGDLAEVGIWNVLLTDDEIAALGRGFSPAMVRPASLTGYWPIWGRHSPELELFEGRALTLTGSPVYAEHPKIIYPTRPKAVALPTVAPWYYYNLFARGQAA